jgi:hypothetical protein
MPQLVPPTPMPQYQQQTESQIGLGHEATKFESGMVWNPESWKSRKWRVIQTHSSSARARASETEFSVLKLNTKELTY